MKVSYAYLGKRAGYVRESYDFFDVQDIPLETTMEAAYFISEK